MEKINITLPSKCKVYQDVDPALITIRTLRGKEEKMISELTSDNFEKKFQQILSSVVEGIDVNKLTLGDRKFLMLWLAINSYSKDFPISFVCENCYQKIDMDVDLSVIPVKELPDNFTEPYPVTMSDGSIVKLRLIRVSDELKLAEMEKSGQNTWLYRFAMSVIGEASVLERAMALENASVIDIARIRAFHDQFDHGPTMQTQYTCEKCGGDGSIAVPFRIEMFFPFGKTLKRYYGTAM